MLCELCGKNEGNFKAIVEGTSLVVCPKCGKFGKVVGRVICIPINVPKKMVVKDEGPTEVVMSDYASKIKQARERSGKTQEEFAKLICEKISVLKKFEASEFAPDIETAKKFERLLKIKLVETTNQKDVIELPKQSKSEGFTIGDFIKVKKIEG